MCAKISDHPLLTPKNIKKFKDYYKEGNKEECWIWPSSYDVADFNVDSKKIRARRFAYMIKYGNIPEGHHIFNKCKNLLCVNPHHMICDLASNYLKNKKRDRYIVQKVAKLRKGNSYPKSNIENHWRGEKHQNSKLTEDAIHDIRNSSLNSKELALKYNVDRSTINSVRRRKTWRHI